MDYQGRSDLKEILVKLYGDAVAGRWEPNEQLYLVFVDLIEASSECSNALAMVPEPLPIGGSVTRWLKKQVRSKVLAFFSDNSNEHYLLCLNAIKWKFRHRFDLANFGV
jgi:hypothetical protein